MRAIVAREPGDPDVLELREVPDPVAGPGQVVVRVRAAGVNRADVLQRRGLYPPPAGASEVLGLECAGEVEELGPGAEGLALGDRIFALLPGGGYAERAVLHASVAMLVPRELDDTRAGAVPEVFATAYDNLVRIGRLMPGEWVLIHGGSGGVGTAAIQVARRRGARPIVTVGTSDRAERCQLLGAEAAIVYRTEDFPRRIREITAGRGVDLILDILGASALDKNLESLATDGRLVVIGAMGGLQAPLSLGRMLARRLSIQATTLRARSDEYKAALARDMEVDVLPALAAGTMRPVLDRTFPLAEAAEAHRRMEAGSHFGKIVLLP